MYVPSQIRALTPREQQVLEFVYLGKCNKEMAATLGVTVRCVRFHMRNILTKFGATGRIELMATAIQTYGQGS
jgi:DNA-binding NarL/FixJ family response regulator